VDGAGAVYTTGAGIFVSQLNSAGSLVWTGGPVAGVGSEGIAVVGQGNIFTTGSFSGTVDFNPGAGAYPLTSAPDSVGNPTVDVFVSKLVPMAALQAAGGVASNATGEANLSAEQVSPLLTEALARWQAAGVDSSAFANIDIRIADLGNATLGFASGNTIWLDDNAAGWGWFIDATPWDDSEFMTPGDQGEQHRMDLLTAIAHELGHLLGYEHSDDGTMHDTLAAGGQHTPTRTVVDRSAIKSSGSRSEPRLSSAFDLIFIDQKEKETTRTSGSLAHDLLGDFEFLRLR
jgi:hypothetical protein